MAVVNLSMEVLFKEVFGYTTTAFEPELKEVAGNNALQRVSQGKYGSPYYSTAPNGRECFLPCKITYAYQGLNRTIELPFCIVSISTDRKFITTDMVGAKGTTVEQILSSNYQINIKGFLINMRNEYPEDGVELLRDLWECTEAVSLSNAMTDIFLLRPERGGSDKVIIRDFSLLPIKGVKNVVGYELSMFSDVPFDLNTIPEKIKEKPTSNFVFNPQEPFL